MFAFSNSKKTLTMTSILLLSVGCVHVSGSNSASSPGLKYSPSDRDVGSSYYDNTKAKPKHWGLWKLLSEGRNKIITIVFVILFALGMTAMLGDFTEFNLEGGKMLFGDEGSSMWLRLAVAIPCLTLPLVAFTVICFRVNKRAEFGNDSKGYKDWKSSQGFGIGKDNFSRILQYMFCGGLLVFALVACYLGGLTEAGEKMYLVAWILPASVGILGFGFVIFKHFRAHKQELDSMKEQCEREKALADFEAVAHDTIVTGFKRQLEIAKKKVDEKESMEEQVEILKATLENEKGKYNRLTQKVAAYKRVVDAKMNGMQETIDTKDNFIHELKRNYKAKDGKLRLVHAEKYNNLGYKQT